MIDLQVLTTDALEAIAKAQNSQELEQLRVNFLGKKGSFTEQLKALGGLSPEVRPAAGAAINQAKDQVQEALSERKTLIDNSAAEIELALGQIDITLPGRK